MKTVYIPKGETVHYESLATEHLVVRGHLHVDYGIKAKTITGGGTINAGTVDADVIRVDDVESGSIVCKRLLAKRVQGSGGLRLGERRCIQFSLCRLCGDRAAHGGAQRD